MNDNETIKEKQEKRQPNKMSFVAALKAVLSNCVNFSGRARRKEYWTFMLLYFIILFEAIVLDVETGFIPSNYGSNYGPITTTIYFILSLPWLAFTIRRFHDCGYGWTYILWIFLPFAGGIIVLIATLEDSEKDANEYGESPKYGIIEEDDWN